MATMKTKSAADSNGKIDGKSPRGGTVEKLSKRAKAAQHSAVERAGDAAQAASATLDSNPLAALAGAIAVGAVAAAFIPTTRREIEALGPWAQKLRVAVEGAFAAAKEAGSGELTTAGLTVAAASDGLGGIVGKIVKAAAASATAAASTVKQARDIPAAAAASSEPAPVDV